MYVFVTKTKRATWFLLDDVCVGFSKKRLPYLCVCVGSQVFISFFTISSITTSSFIHSLGDLFCLKTQTRKTIKDPNNASVLFTLKLHLSPTFHSRLYWLIYDAVPSSFPSSSLESLAIIFITVPCSPLAGISSRKNIT